MKRKKKFIMSSISLAMSIAFCIVGVYSAITDRSLQISGTIKFTASDLEANVAINEYYLTHTYNENEGDPTFTDHKEIIKRMPIINTADENWKTGEGNAHVYQLGEDGKDGNIEVSGAEATNTYAYEIVIENKMEARPLYATFAIRKDYRPGTGSSDAPQNFPDFLEVFSLGVDIYSNTEGSGDNDNDYNKIENFMEGENQTGYNILDQTSKYTTFHVSKDNYESPGTTIWRGNDYDPDDPEAQNKFKMTNDESTNYLRREFGGDIEINLVDADNNDYYYYSVMLNTCELLVLTYTYIADRMFAGVAEPHVIGLVIDLLSTPPAITNIA